MFQLKHRLARLRVSQPVAAISPIAASESESAEIVAGSTLHTDEEVVVDADGVCDGKPEAGNKTIRARFGRRRTHNEQLCVASCGIILGRATFYGSEAPNGVRVSKPCILSNYTNYMIYRHSGNASFLPENQSLLSFGMIITAGSVPC